MKWKDAHEFGNTMYDIGADFGELFVALFGI
jgi:hypothetical protein